jgi:hypothetical protein
VTEPLHAVGEDLRTEQQEEKGADQEDAVFEDAGDAEDQQSRRTLEHYRQVPDRGS